MKIIKTPISRMSQTYISHRTTLDKNRFKEILSENYPLLGILIGFMLVALSIGPYYNGDIAWEYDAVSGVIKYGLPFANGSYLIDQPPLGFYIQAIFFKVFGMSINNGTFLVSLFGLGCIFLLYKIGRVFYDKTTGLVAAALFAFTPWQFILSRSFLIDVQCLFFSLLYLLVGIIGIRKGSLKFLTLSGFLFAAAFLAKFFAVFTLIPLLIYHAFNRPKNLKRTLSSLAAFFLPVLIFFVLWYQVISGQGILSIFQHGDFINESSTQVVPSYLFAFNFLVNYGLGWFLIDAAILSLLVCLMQRKLFQKFLLFDLICLATVICVLAINTFLGVTLNLKSPYLNAIKYDYQSLPFFCILAASLLSKSFSLFNLSKTKRKLSKLTHSLIASIGLVLVAAAILYNMRYVHMFSTWNYLIFRVEPSIDRGYSLFNATPIGENSLLMGIQYLGFAVLLSGFLYAIRHKIIQLRRLRINN